MTTFPITTATIAEGATESSVIDVTKLGQAAVVILPAEMTGSAITFKAAPSPYGTFSPVYNEGTAYSVNIAGGRAIVLDPTVFFSLPFLKIVSGSEEGAARDIIVVGREA